MVVGILIRTDAIVHEHATKVVKEKGAEGQVLLSGAHAGQAGSHVNRDEVGDAKTCCLETGMDVNLVKRGIRTSYRQREAMHARAHLEHPEVVEEGPLLNDGCLMNLLNLWSDRWGLLLPQNDECPWWVGSVCDILTKILSDLSGSLGARAYGPNSPRRRW